MVAVVDYGIWQPFTAWVKALVHERRGLSIVSVSTRMRLPALDRLVLPGVGAFADGMRGPGPNAGWLEPLQEYARCGRPFLGICLGMQMMFEVSEGFGLHRGLGLIPGRVVPVSPTGEDGRPHKIPHIGWNELVVPGDARRWEGTLLSGITRGRALRFISCTPLQPSPQGRNTAWRTVITMAASFPRR